MKSQLQGGGAFAALSREITEAVERTDPWIVSIDARGGFPTSGVVWSEGIVVAANHTLVREGDLTVRFPDGARTSVGVAGRDPGSDLAVLKLDTGKRPTAPVDAAAEPAAGELVLAVGRNSEHGLRASLGVIGGVGGQWQTARGASIDRYILLDLSTFPGFSGGPLVDAEARVLGINTTGLSRHSGVAIPVSTVERVVKELSERGHVRRGYLGVGLYPLALPAHLRASLKIEGDGGLMIIGVEEGGPAARGGILLGDVIVALDGKPIEDHEALQSRLGTESVGKRLAITVLRGDRLVQASVEIGERPARGQ